MSSTPNLAISLRPHCDRLLRQHDYAGFRTLAELIEAADVLKRRAARAAAVLKRSNAPASELPAVLRTIAIDL